MTEPRDHDDQAADGRAADGRAADGRAADARRDLAPCPTCNAEARPAPPAKVGTVLFPELPPAWRAVLTGAAAALLLVGLAFGIWIQSERMQLRTGVVQAFRLEPLQPSAQGNLVTVPVEAASFQLVVPVDLDADQPAVSIEIFADDGPTIFTRDEVSTFYRDRFLMVICARADFPDGDYVLRFTAVGLSGAAPAAPTEIRFTVRTR